MENLSMVWVLLALLFLMEFMYLKQSYAIERERREHEELIRLFGKIAYHRGFVDGGMRAGYDYDREYPIIKEHFKEKMGEGE